MTTSAAVPLEARCGCPVSQSDPSLGRRRLPLRRYPENLARIALAAPALAEFAYLELFSYRCPKCKQIVDITLEQLLGAGLSPA
jgi:hypothetical protein